MLHITTFLQVQLYFPVSPNFMNLISLKAMGRQLELSKSQQRNGKVLLPDYTLTAMT